MDSFTGGFAIAFGIAIGTGLRQGYLRWKANRTTIPTHQNWRGEWVPDLWLRRLERLGCLAILVFCIGSVAGGVYFLLAKPASPAGTATPPTVQLRRQ
jgi:hypothetical protein